MAELDKEFEFYKEKKQELFSKYENKFIVIVGQKVIGAYDNRLEAINKTKEQHDLGTFLVQHVIEDDEAAFFHSRVILKHGKSA